MKSLTAEEARQLAGVAARATDKIRSDRIDASVKKILKEIREAATNGQHEIVFSPGHLEYQSEREMVKIKLEELGYSIDEESDMGMKYDLIHW